MASHVQVPTLDCIASLAIPVDAVAVCGPWVLFSDGSARCFAAHIAAATSLQPDAEPPSDPPPTCQLPQTNQRRVFKCGPADAAFAFCVITSPPFPGVALLLFNFSSCVKTAVAAWPGALNLWVGTPVREAVAPSRVRVPCLLSTDDLRGATLLIVTVDAPPRGTDDPETTVSRAHALPAELRGRIPALAADGSFAVWTPNYNERTVTIMDIATEATAAVDVVACAPWSDQGDASANRYTLTLLTADTWLLYWRPNPDDDDPTLQRGCLLRYDPARRACCCLAAATVNAPRSHVFWSAVEMLWWDGADLQRLAEIAAAMSNSRGDRSGRRAAPETAAVAVFAGSTEGSLDLVSGTCGTFASVPGDICRAAVVVGSQVVVVGDTTGSRKRVFLLPSLHPLSNASAIDPITLPRELVEDHVEGFGGLGDVAP